VPQLKSGKKTSDDVGEYEIMTEFLSKIRALCQEFRQKQADAWQLISKALRFTYQASKYYI